MINGLREGIFKVVTHVATGLHALVVFALLISVLLLMGDFPELVELILIIMLGVVVLATILFLVFNPRRLQFTGKETMIWECLRLGDSEMQRQYLFGQESDKGPEPLIEDMREEE